MRLLRGLVLPAMRSSDKPGRFSWPLARFGMGEAYYYLSVHRWLHLVQFSRSSPEVGALLHCSLGDAPNRFGYPPITGEEHQVLCLQTGHQPLGDDERSPGIPHKVMDYVVAFGP